MTLPVFGQTQDPSPNLLKVSVFPIPHLLLHCHMRAKLEISVYNFLYL